jgi:hypothetical protein
MWLPFGGLEGLTVSAVDFVDGGKRREIGDEEEIKEELDVGGCFVVLELGVVEEALVLRGQFGGLIDVVAAVAVRLGLSSQFWLAQQNGDILTRGLLRIGSRPILKRLQSIQS